MISQVAHGRRFRSFTLVELLVVISIVAILLIAVVPVVNTLSKSNNRKATASLLLSVIEQARALAIKDGRATYVAFPAAPPGATSGVTDQTLIDRYFYHSAAIFEDNADLTVTTKVQVTPWKVFPTGISLRTEVSFPAPAPPATTTSNASWTADTFLFTPYNATTPQSFPCMKFDESGALVVPTAINPGAISLRFFEGFVTGTTEKPTTQQNKDETISIAAVTGRATYVP